jgi:hypothetical protein
LPLPIIRLTLEQVRHPCREAQQEDGYTQANHKNGQSHR